MQNLEEGAFVAVLRTAEYLQRRAAEMFKRHGLSPTQYNVLRILRGAGVEGLACSEVGERMLNHDPDITRLLDRLGARGLIERSRGKNDRRVITTRIAPAGLELLRSLDRPVEEFQRRLFGHVSERRLRSLIRLLELACGSGHGQEVQKPLTAKMAKKSREGR
jgi:MarR family transcriptional regulator, organic hydroperoxide resistance regulator